MRTFLVTTTAVAAVFSSAAFTQETNPSTASIPDFFGVWNHPSFPWYEPPASGPGPVTNRSRWPSIVNQRPPAGGGSPGLPPS